MADANNIKDIVLKEKLTFLHSILQLPDQAAPRQVLLELITPQILGYHSATPPGCTQPT